MRRFAAFVFLIVMFACPSFAGTWVAQGSPTSEALYGTYAFNTGAAVAVGSKQTIIRAANGISWESKAASNVSYSCNAVHFPGANVGYAAGGGPTVSDNSGYIWKTVDGGVNWSAAIILSVDAGNFGVLTDVFFVSDSTGWATGVPPKGGITLYKTVNGGTSWTLKGTGLPSANYYALHFVDASNGWVVGEGGCIYKTGDGGDSWTQQAAGLTTSTLVDVYFTDSNHGWAVGTAAAILKTTNGGSTWTSISTPVVSSDQNLTAVHFVDNNGWATGYAPGFIIKTTDGGDTWALETLPSAITLWDIYFTDQYNGWAVGGGGGEYHGESVKAAATYENIFKYVTSPTITSISPSARYQGWSGNVILTGTNFLPAVTAEAVKSGGSGFAINSYTRDSSTQITLTTTASTTATTGGWTINIYNPDRRTASATFTLNPPPSVESVTRRHPTEGYVNWDSRGAMRQIIISGEGFQSGATASFEGDGFTISSTSLESSKTLKANVQISTTASIGWRDVTVVNPDAGSAAKADAFEVKPDTVGPIITNLTIEGASAAASLNIPRRYPVVTCDIYDSTGLTLDTLNFKVLLGTPVKYLWEFSTDTFDLLTPEASDPTHQGYIHAVLQHLKLFTDEAIRIDPLAIPSVFDTPQDFYIYAEDREGNPTMKFYDTVHFPGVAPVPSSRRDTISEFLTEPNYQPTPSNPVTLQFDSNGYEGTLTIYLLCITTRVSRTITDVAIHNGQNRIDFNGLDSGGELLTNGIYFATFVDSRLGYLGGGKIVIAR